MDAAQVPAVAGQGLNTLDLDRLFHEGDDQTWDMEDWNWDPYQIIAEPKGSPSRPNTHQQPMKRHKTDNNGSSSNACHPAAAGMVNPAAAAAPAGCHAGAVLQQQQQQGMNGLGPFQSLLANGTAACNVNGMSGALWGQQFQQQQQQGAAANAAAAAACGASCTSQNPNAPAPLRSCQALAHGLPFLTPVNFTNVFQQQQQQQMLARHASMDSVNAAAAAAVVPAAHPSMMLGANAATAVGLDLNAMPRVASAPMEPLAAAAPAAAAAAPLAAAASPSGLECSSVAESGSDIPGSAAMSGQQQQQPPAIMLPNPTPAAGAANQQQQQQLTSPSTMASTAPAPPALQIAAAADSEAAAASAAVAIDGDGGDGGDGDQKMVCQVPGCGRDLSGLKEYHQRYRICDVHIKLPQVMKDGRLQRFCQQCGRFHDLSAFDGNRKSCREQLQKHNARRRRRAQLEQNMSLADSLLTAVDDKSEVGKLLQGLLSNPFQLQALRVLLGVQTNQALPNPAPAPAEHMPQLVAAGTLPANAAAAPQTYEVARDIMDGNGTFAPSFDSEHRVVRLSAKLFNVTPADLPPDVRQQLTGWLASAPAAVEGYIRPGCILMGLHMTVDKREYDAAVATGMQRLLQQVLSPFSHPFWHSHIYMLQLFTTVAVIYHGQLVSLTAMADADLASHKLPHQLSVSPLCLVSSSSSSLTFSGNSISSPDCTIVVKGSGSHLYLGSSSGNAASVNNGCSCCHDHHQHQQQQHPAVAAVGKEVVKCEISADRMTSGVMWAEVAKGAYVSEARPVLVVEDPHLAQEINSLQQLEGTVLSASQVDSLLLDLGLVLKHIQTAPAAAAAAASHGLDHHAIAEKARRLIAFACDQGWAAVAQAVLPLAQACGACAHDIVAAIHSSTAQDGLSLLHRAVRSGSPGIVRGILDWGVANNYQWPISNGGPGGITPLHLASLLDDDGVIALMLLDACGTESATALTEAQADDGVTPFHLAFQMGRHSLDRVLAGLGIAPVVKSVLEQQLEPNGWQLLKMAAEADDGSTGSTTLSGTEGAAALKERLTSCLDACLYCQSTLPPLLLSIKAKCAGCGVRQPCVQDSPPVTPTAVAAAAAAKATSAKAAVAAACPPMATARPSGVDAAAAACAHVNGRVLSVTALCQACHANRVLEVV